MNKFDHVFSGYSVWVEPCETSSIDLVHEIESLAEKCGGAERGVHTFPPHLTLLYNIDSKKFETKGVFSKVSGEEYLNRALDVYKTNIKQLTLQRQNERQSKSSLSEMSDGVSTSMNNGKNGGMIHSTKFDLIPTELYYFHYPKTADDGRGFGCVIFLLLIENLQKHNGNLNILHKAVLSVFPPDERHDGGKVKFIPHMSLVYAPESETWLQDLVKEGEEGGTKTSLLKKLPAKYLSLWKTEGKISEWCRVALVEISD